MQDDVEFLVLYDGLCLFCEGWVNFVIDRTDDSQRIQFLPLDFVQLAPAVERLLAEEVSADSIVCISSLNRAYVKSDASLMILKQLSFPYGFLAGVLCYVPAGVRNLVYDFIGKRRYRIFGKKDVCQLPLGATKRYFVDSDEALSGPIKAIYRDFFSFKTGTGGVRAGSTG